MTRRLVVGPFLLLALAACAVGLGCEACEARGAVVTAETGEARQQGSWPQFTHEFVEGYFRAQPFFAVSAGRHEFDGQMPDWSANGLRLEALRLHELRTRAAAFQSAVLTPSERFERDYLLTVIDSDLFWNERARFPFTNPVWYIDRLDPEVYLSRDYAPLPKRLSAYVSYLRAIPHIAADIRANLGTPLPPTFIQRGIDGFDGFAQFFRNDAPKVFVTVQNAAAQKELLVASEAAAKAMDGLKQWLLSQRGEASGSFALGESLFLEMLRTTEQVDMPIALLVQVGRADLERNTRALKEACASYLPQGTLVECVAKERGDKPNGGAVEGARTQLEELRAFIIKHKLVSVPSNERPLVAESPPYNRANGAYINIPGPFETTVASVYNIAPPDPAWSAKERAEYIPGKAGLLYTSVHEVWPGHFLQFLHANRNPSKIAAIWVGYGYAEGWAHYSEEMMWEAGLGNGAPEQHIGQLTDALLRDVRFISAIGLHTEGMTVAESERLFRESAFQDPGSARQQAARGTYDPQYLKYTLGKLMIRKLRADWIARQPGGAAATDPRPFWHEFHDKFLSYGGPPIPMVRTAMLGDVGSPL